MNDADIILLKDIGEVLKDKVFDLKQMKAERIKLTKELLLLKGKINTLEKIKNYVVTIGEKFRKEKKEFIEDTVTLALQSVFGETFGFEMQFNMDKRDQLEVIFFVREGELLLEPRLGTGTVGGSVIDVCSFALQMVCLSFEIKANNISPILIMDEPFRNVDGVYINAVNEMITDTSDLMGIQIIMNTHNTIFIENAQNIIYTPEISK